MGIVKDGEFPKMHEYFEKYMTAIEESNRSTKSLAFLETLRDLKQEEIKALMDSMDGVMVEWLSGSRCFETWHSILLFYLLLLMSI